jgi:Amidase
VQYGTPKNVNVRDRIAGGSSNRSAAAVVAGLFDFALGTDCDGSIRTCELLRIVGIASDVGPHFSGWRVVVPTEF